MQLRNKPLAMEKRTDLASLFCMIGRHGPAVAVAVIAMVSVVAGFIIYRSVKGKRMKAAAAARDDEGGSRGASQLESETEPEPECEVGVASGRVESTDLSEDDLLDMKVANVSRSPYNLRNRRAAAEKSATSNCSPEKELEPENRPGTSHVWDSSSVTCGKGVWTVEDVCKLNLPDDETSKDAEKVRGSCLMPVVTSVGHENEKVPKAQEVEGTVKDVLDKKPKEKDNKLVMSSQVHPENAAANQNQDHVRKENQTTPETINLDSCLEEPVICMDGVTVSSKDVKTKIPHPDHIKSSDGNNSLPLVNEVESVPQNKYAHYQQIALDHAFDSSPFEQTKGPSSQQGKCENMTETMSGVHDSLLDADCTQFSELIEKDMDKDHLKNLAIGSPVKPEYRKQELESEHATNPLGNQDNYIVGVTLSSSEECCSSSRMLNIALPCLNQLVESETLCDDQGLSDTKANLYGLPPVCLQQEHKVKDGVSLELAKDTGGCGLKSELGNLQSEKNETSMDVMVPKQRLDILLSSADRDSDTIVEMVCSDMPAFSNKESEQVVSADLSEVATVFVPDMAFDESEQTWSASGVGEESGISSMTVSPDLPDIECDLTPDKVALSLTNQDLKSEEHVEAQSNSIADKAPFVRNDIPAEMVLESGPAQHSQQAQREHTEANYKLSPAKWDPSGHEIEENFKQDSDQLTAQVVTSGCCLMDELRNEMDRKADVENDQKERAEGEDKMTEISIMEATMDTNEWITDGNHEVLPWMNLSISSPLPNTQTGPVSSEHHPNSAHVDAPCKITDPLLLTEVKQSNIVDESKGSDKKVVAVQPMPQNVNVTFRIHYLTHSPYQKVAITGNQEQLGNWKGFILLEKARDGHWSTVVNLPAESHVEWKFVVVERGEVCRWEECGNRLLDTGYAEDLLVHKWWGFL